MSNFVKLVWISLNLLVVSNSCESVTDGMDAYDKERSEMPLWLLSWWEKDRDAKR